MVNGGFVLLVLMLYSTTTPRRFIVTGLGLLRSNSHDPSVSPLVDIISKGNLVKQPCLLISKGLVVNTIDKPCAK